MTTSDTSTTRLSECETGNSITRPALAFGVAAIDDRLEGSGLAFGALHEVAGGGNGAAHAVAATLFVAGILARTEGTVLWCLKQRDLFAPALAQAGLNMERVVFMEAGHDKGVLECFEEGLRRGDVACVVAEISKLSLTAARRLQSAAQSAGVLGIAMRRWYRREGAKDWALPAVAHTRWKVTALADSPLSAHLSSPERWGLELMRCPSGERAYFEIEACNDKGDIALSPALSPVLAPRTNESPVKERRPFPGFTLGARRQGEAQLMRAGDHPARRMGAASGMAAS